VEGLLGRGEERSRLDETLARARQGHSAALVIRGEPGVGKTALLDYTQAAAAAVTPKPTHAHRPPPRTR
jgi:ATP-dependent Clp protease ATP-binding subunit ClpA